jgi:hypothetical protein
MSQSNITSCCICNKTPDYKNNQTDLDGWITEPSYICPDCITHQYRCSYCGKITTHTYKEKLLKSGWTFTEVKGQEMAKCFQCNLKDKNTTTTVQLPTNAKKLKDLCDITGSDTGIGKWTELQLRTRLQNFYSISKATLEEVESLVKQVVSNIGDKVNTAIGDHKIFDEPTIPPAKPSNVTNPRFCSKTDSITDWYNIDKMLGSDVTKALRNLETAVHFSDTEWKRPVENKLLSLKEATYSLLDVIMRKLSDFIEEKEITPIKLPPAALLLEATCESIRFYSADKLKDPVVAAIVEKAEKAIEETRDMLKKLQPPAHCSSQKAGDPLPLNDYMKLVERHTKENEPKTCSSAMKGLRTALDELVTQMRDLNPPNQPIHGRNYQEKLNDTIRSLNWVLFQWARLKEAQDEELFIKKANEVITPQPELGAEKTTTITTTPTPRICYLRKSIDIMRNEKTTSDTDVMDFARIAEDAIDEIDDLLNFYHKSTEQNYPEMPDTITSLKKAIEEMENDTESEIYDKLNYILTSAEYAIKDIDFILKAITNKYPSTSPAVVKVKKLCQKYHTAIGEYNKAQTQWIHVELVEPIIEQLEISGRFSNCHIELTSKERDSINQER